jgi:hypothetical protein
MSGGAASIRDGRRFPTVVRVTYALSGLRKEPKSPGNSSAKVGVRTSRQPEAVVIALANE